MKLNFYFEDDDLFNTALIDEEYEIPAYATDGFWRQPLWAWAPILDTLAIYGLWAQKKRKYTAAGLKFKKGRIVNMSFLLSEMDLNSFQAAMATPGCVRPFAGPNKIKYAWVVDADTMVCYEEFTGRIAARTRWVQCGPDDKLRLRLEIGDKDHDSTDSLVVTCIICEYERRSKHKEVRKGSFFDT